MILCMFSPLNKDGGVNAFRSAIVVPVFSYRNAAKSRLESSSNGKVKIELDRELEKFFESASSTGSANIAALTPEERMELTVRGAYLEDEIFSARERLMDLQERYMKGDKSIDKEEIMELRQLIQGLKEDYIEVVGAKDVPIYFGRIPDVLQ